MPKQQFIQNQVLYKVENRRSTSLFSIASPKQKKGKKKRCRLEEYPKDHYFVFHFHCFVIYPNIFIIIELNASGLLLNYKEYKPMEFNSVFRGTFSHFHSLLL